MDGEFDVPTYTSGSPTVGSTEMTTTEFGGALKSENTKYVTAPPSASDSTSRPGESWMGVSESAATSSYMHVVHAYTMMLKEHGSAQFAHAEVCQRESVARITMTSGPNALKDE